MKISDLIALLQVEKDLNGDLDVAILTEAPDGLFCFNRHVKAEVVDMMDPSETVLAIAWGEVLPDEDYDQPRRAPLKLVD